MPVLIDLLDILVAAQTIQSAMSLIQTHQDEECAAILCRVLTEIDIVIEVEIELKYRVGSNLSLSEKNVINADADVMSFL